MSGQPKDVRERTRERITKMRVQGFSVREIAAALGVTTQAVYQQLDRIEAEQKERAV